MINYPKNQTYVIVPVEKALSAVGNVLEICRKSIDNKFMIWHYHEKDKQLDNIKKDVKIKLMTHSEALELMNTKNWISESLLT